MIKLTLVLAGRTVVRHELGDDVELVTIGRDDDNDIQIDNLSISRHHCEITRTGEVYQLRDVGSDNGTFVNGSQITRVHNLNAGDRIEFGKYELRFEQDRSQEEPAPQRKPGKGPQTAHMGMERIRRPKATGYLRPADGSKIIPVEKSPFLFGKRRDCDVKLTGWSCPAVVAILVSDEAGFHLVDMSTNLDSVKVNGTGRRDVWLNEEDEVEVRGKKMSFHRGRPVPD